NAWGNVRMPDGTQVNGIELTQLVDRSGRQRLLGAQVAFAAEIKMLEFVFEPFHGRDGLEHFEPFGRHFRPGAVAANHGDFCFSFRRCVQCNLPSQMSSGAVRRRFYQLANMVTSYAPMVRGCRIMPFTDPRGGRRGNPQMSQMTTDEEGKDLEKKLRKSAFN